MSTTNRRKQDKKSKNLNTYRYNEPKHVAGDEYQTNRLFEMNRKEGTSQLRISGRPSYKQDQTENLHRCRQENLQETEESSDSETEESSDSETGTIILESSEPKILESSEPKILESSEPKILESFEPKLKPNRLTPYGIILVLLASMIYFVLLNAYANTSNPNDPIHCMDKMKEKYTRQDEMFWRTIISGINLTVHSQHPTSFIFVYEDAAETTTQKLMIDLSKCGCILHTCNSSAVNFNKEILESEIFSKIEDYGSVLTHLKHKLEDNGLMIVENLDKVPEKFALAFHTICDEAAPFVKQSTIFFTMKMDKFKRNALYDLRYVYDVLKGKWKNVEYDKFEPLLTRISSMILRVHPEEY